MMKKRIGTSVLCLFLCLLFVLQMLCLPLTAAEDLEMPDTGAAKAAYLYHVEHGTAIIANNETALLPAASTVKVLSGLLFCELLSERGNELVRITKEMVWGVTGHRLGLSDGDVLSITELLYAAVCGSYNDAFAVLAQLSGTSTEGFVKLMNQRAAEIGVEKSVFTDPIGTADFSLTTAAELAKIAAVAYQNELYTSICKTAKYYITSLSKNISNRNEMIVATTTNKHYNNKCNGMSVGSTTMGGDCIVASFTNGRESYIAVVLGCAESDSAAQNMAYTIAGTMADWVYATYTDLDIISPETVVCKIPVTVSDMTTEVEVKTNQTLTAYLPSTVEIGREITYSIRLTHTELEAPVAEGMFVGYVAVLYNGEIIDTLPLYTAGTAERSSFVSSLKAIQALFRDRRVVAGVIFFLVVLIAWIAVEALWIRHNHRRWNKYFSSKIDTTKRKKK